MRARIVLGLLAVVLACPGPARPADVKFQDRPFAERLQALVGTWDGRFGMRARRMVIESVEEFSGGWHTWGRIETPSEGDTRKFRATIKRGGDVVLRWKSREGGDVELALRDERTLVGTVQQTTGRNVPSRLVKQSAAVAATPAPSPTPAPAATIDHPYADSWALVIGINAYQKVTPRLNYAVADAQAVAAALPALGFPRENVRLLLDGDATKTHIETVLYRDFARMGSQDRLLVYFAGHGDTLAIRGGDEGYLLPVDADPKALPLTAIAMDEVKRITQRLNAKHYLFIMDACFSGFAMTRDIVVRGITDDHLAAAAREPVVQVITAGRKGERSVEEGGHGLFTRRLLDGLRGLADPDGRGIITAAQLAAWIEPRVLRDSKGRMTPQYGKLDGEGQFIFVRPGAR